MPEIHKIGLLEEFPVGDIRIIKAGGVEIGILRLANGEVHAIRNTCPHKVAPVCRGFLSGTWSPSGPGELQFTRDGEVLQCPRHGWEFDVRSGFELYQERPARLKKYDVKIEDHEILVTI